MGDFRKLKVWREAHRTVLSIYKVTGHFPRHEMYGMTSQMRRAGVSIASNIAEGYGRGGDRELLRYLRIALGSVSELEYQLLLAKDLGYLTADRHEDLEAGLLILKRRLVVFSQKAKEDVA